MSYLSKFLHGEMSLNALLAKSASYLKAKAGVTISDDAVDATVVATDEFTDKLGATINAYVAAHLPGLPATVAQSAVSAVLLTLDAAVAGAGNAIKENN